MTTFTSLFSLLKRFLPSSLFCLLGTSCSLHTSTSEQLPNNELLGASSRVAVEGIATINLLDFEAVSDAESVKLSHGRASRIKHAKGHALNIHLDSASVSQSHFALQPAKPWDWSHWDTVAVAIDIANPTNSSTHLYVYTYDKQGDFQLRNVGIPANSSETYLIELNVPTLEVNTGIRNNPPSWQSGYQPVIWRGGKKVLDVSGITQISFRVFDVLEDKQLIIDNVRALSPNQFDSQHLTGLVDKYGQNAKLDFPNKVISDKQLDKMTKKELASLRHKPIAGRSKFNGWVDGPKLKATGFYRTEKYQGRWSLVDPEGYLFFSNGIANIRMANTSTITGYDFDHALIEERKVGDHTPEDSIGLNRVPEQAWSSRQVSSPLRANMFNWLPDYDQPEAAHYGYRREVHLGAIERGETYSFYKANLARKYKTHDTDELMAKWRDVTIDRMHTWGFTSFGNWVDPSFYQMDRLPYFANGWVIGDFKTVSSGNDYWGPMPDPFDPVFDARVEATVSQIAREVQNSPWCVGVFVDNEKSWGSMGSIEGQYGIPINALALDAQHSPLKARFLKTLQAKYTDIQKLNDAWDAKFVSWQAFAKGVKLLAFNDALVEDLSALLFDYADAYFKKVDAAMAQHMPNHMYLGPRFAHWAMTPEVRKAAAQYVDVMSYNYYREGISDTFWDFLDELDMPSIIGEFHNGAMDSGLLNPGLIHAESQSDRGKKYQDYVYSALDNPYFVGTHWFQYIDSPLTGRAYDGENYNVGFVSIVDTPYMPLVDAVKELNTHLYQRRFGVPHKAK